MKSACIIKLDGMGDVLRTTPILRRLGDREVTWITLSDSAPLLEGNPGIRRVLTLGQVRAAPRLAFDELYNFDEDLRACALASEIPAGKKKGYALRAGTYIPFDADAKYAFELSRNDELKFRQNTKTYQQVIFEMAGLRWEGEDYVLGYRPQGMARYQVGINYLVGEKFPNKAWPHWKELAGMLESVSVQRRFERVTEYIEWINSCRIFVTGDSLGMHIALALKKKVIVLMGSTSWNEIETYGRASILKADFACAPCYKKERCVISPSCMDAISPEKVREEIVRLMKSSGGRSG